MTFSSILALGAFLAISFAVATSGAIFRPGPWYENLQKPSWTPPNWAFPVVWTALYIAMSVAAWFVWGVVGIVPAVFAPFVLQWIFNALWSYLFFGLRRPDLAFADMIALWASVAAAIFAFAPISPPAAWLLAPYLLWVTIAGCLNWSVWRKNVGAFPRSA